MSHYPHETHSSDGQIGARALMKTITGMPRAIIQDHRPSEAHTKNVP